MNGAAHTALPLGNSPSLLGASFFQQSTALEFGAAMTLAAVRASNGIAVTIGGL